MGMIRASSLPGQIMCPAPFLHFTHDPTVCKGTPKKLFQKI
jgi:hypothetical protein